MGANTSAINKRHRKLYGEIKMYRPRRQRGGNRFSGSKHQRGGNRFKGSKHQRGGKKRRRRQHGGSAIPIESGYGKYMRSIFQKGGAYAPTTRTGDLQNGGGGFKLIPWGLMSKN